MKTKRLFQLTKATLAATLLATSVGLSPTAIAENTTTAVSDDVRDMLTVIMNGINANEKVVNSLMVLTPGESTPFEISNGMADPQQQIAMTRDHQFHIASMTKPFTSVLLLQLVSEGYFELDTKLGEIFGDTTFDDFFPGHAFYEQNPDGVRVGELNVKDIQRFGGESNGASITIRQLVQHTHGMPDVTFDAPDGGESIAEILIKDAVGLPTTMPGVSQFQWSGERIFEYYLASGLPDQSLFKPGANFYYTDTGYVLAGLLIEKATGLPLSEAYRTRIFDRLGMNDSYLHHYETPRASQSVGIAHRFWSLNGLSPDLPNLDLDESGVNTSIDWAGGGLVSTVDDINRFFRGLVSGVLLSDSMLKQMLTWVAGDGLDDKYGLGWEVVVDEDSGKPIAIAHGGFWGSYMIYLPEFDTSLVLTANQVNFADDYIEQIQEALFGGSKQCEVDLAPYKQKIEKLKHVIQRKNQIIKRKKKIIRKLREKLSK